MRLLLAPAVLLLAASFAAAQHSAAKDAKPAAEAKPPGPAAKWEYAELSYRTARGTPARTDAEGKALTEAVPAGVNIRWTTGSDELLLKGWGELAEKVKGAVRKDGSASLQRIQALNAVGADGWEVVTDQPGPSYVAGNGRDLPAGWNSGPGTGATLFLKRRVP